MNNSNMLNMLDYQIKTEELAKETIFLREYTPKKNVLAKSTPKREENENIEEREETY